MYGVCGDADHDITRQLIHYHNPGSLRGVTFNDDGSVQEELYLREMHDVVRTDGSVEQIELTCRADGIIDTPHGEALLEIKGMGFWAYDWLNKAYNKGLDEGTERLMTKHRGYYDQCQIAMHLTGHRLTYLLVKDRSTGTLGLLDKKTGLRSGIYIKYDAGYVKGLLLRFAHVARKLREGEAPIPERPDGSYECNYCDFYYRCHGKFNTGKVDYPGPQVEEHESGSEDGSAEAES
jgi:hypothetical protein